MKLHLKGRVISAPVLITVSINKEQVFLGSVTQQLDKEINFFEYEHKEKSVPTNPIIIDILVLSGTMSFGSALIWVDDFEPKVPGFYTPRDNCRHTPSSDIDHRQNILINNVAPEMPPEILNYNGWFFELTEKENIIFEIVFPYWPKSAQQLPFCQGDAKNNNLQWYDAEGNKIDSDPLGEDFWIARQNGVDQ
jgi:hypothetical protein